MAEDKKNWFLTTVNYLKEGKKGSRIFETTTAFGMAVGSNAIAQGFFNDDADWSKLFSWATLITGFTGGLGIIAVQEDAMGKASERFLTKDVMYKKYHDDNVEKAYQIRDYDFQRDFVKKLNEQELNDLIYKETTKRTNDLESLIFNLEQKIPLMTNTKKKQIEKIDKSKNELVSYQKELKEIKEHGINKASLNFEPFQVSDIFNFNENEVKYGRASIKDDSVKKQRKSNLLSRFYMPALMMILSNGAAALLKTALLPILLSSIAFVFILIFVWYIAHKNQYQLKVNITLPREIKINTHLTDAKSQYDLRQKTVAVHEPIKSTKKLISTIKCPDCGKPATASSIFLGYECIMENCKKVINGLQYEETEDDKV